MSLRTLVKTAGGYVTRYIGMVSGISNPPAQVSGIETNVSGDLFVFATFYINNASCQAVLLKFSSNGVLLWKKSISGLTRSSNITIDLLGNVYLLGHKTPSTGNGITGLYSFLLKVDTDGNIVWQKKETNTTFFRYYRLSTDSNGNIYTVGTYSNSVPVSILISKYTSTGDLVFQTSYKLLATTTTEGYGICTDSIGNIYITGSTSTAGNTAGYLLKLNSAGTLVWQKSLGTVLGTVLCATNSVNEICISNGTVVAKLDSSGNYIWQKSNSNGETKCSDLYIDNLDNIYFGVYNSLGATGAGTRLFKYDSNGTQIFQRLLDSSSPTTYPASIAIDKLGSLFIGDYLTGSYLFAFKLTSSGSLTGTYTIGAVSRTYAVNTGAVETTPTNVTANSSLVATKGYPLNFKITYTAAVYFRYMDSSGNIYLASFNLLTKLDSFGTIVWRKTITGLTSAQPQIVVDNASGTIYYAGKIAAGIAIIAFDSTGTILWQKLISGIAGSFVVAIDFYATDLYVSCNLTTNTILKCSTIDGTVAWAKNPLVSTYGNIKAVSDGVYFVGSQTITDGWTRGFFGKLSSTGTISLRMSIKGGSGSGPDIGFGIAVDSSENIYVAARRTHSGSTYSNALYKFNSTGTKIWEKSLNLGGSGFQGIVLDSTGNIYASGDGHIFKFNSNGTPLWGYSSVPSDRLNIDSSDNLIASVSVSNAAVFKLPPEQLIGTYAGGTYVSSSTSLTTATSTIATVNVTVSNQTITAGTATISIADNTTTTFTKTGMGLTSTAVETFALAASPGTVTMKVF